MRAGHLSTVVRTVVGLSGSVAMRMDLRLRFDYGLLPPWCEQTAEGLTATIGPDRVTLSSPVQVNVKDDAAVADFVVAEGQQQIFVLSYAPSDQPARTLSTPSAPLMKRVSIGENGSAVSMPA